MNYLVHSFNPIYCTVLKSLLFVASNAMNISFHTYTRVVELIKQGKTLSKFIPHEIQGQTNGRGHQALC